MKIAVVGGGPGGLYFALLAKKHWPDWTINVFERNSRGSTFGFGVVFSDETLSIFRDNDRESYEDIRHNFAYWDDLDVVIEGNPIRFSGNGFCGCSRKTLLDILGKHCARLGVNIEYETELRDLAEIKDHDLVVAGDGINSGIRERYKDHFGTQTDLRSNKFVWMGSTKPLDAFKYFFRDTGKGWIVAHCYQYEKGRSTWVIETTDACWKALGLDGADEAGSARALEEIFSSDLDGHKLITDRSYWRNFPNITNRTWTRDNIVLIGDAKATAHYSIGSGTKLAMEDAIALFESLKAENGIGAALAHYDSNRRLEVEKTQHAANVSLSWFEHLDMHMLLEPDQAAFSLMSRSKQITYENLRLRDPCAISRIDRWFATRLRDEGYDVKANDPLPPAFQPFRLREMPLENRFVVSPMAQYSALEGNLTDWHFTHYTSRALGGAGLIFTEMTCPTLDARISPGCACLFDENQMRDWKRIVDFVHKHSKAKICLQLGHAGRKGSTQLGWEDADHPLPHGNWPIISASPLPYFEGISQVPREMNRADMDDLIAAMIKSVELGEMAGFDMVEAHFAHGYLLASFISPLTNKRTDQYGGPLENRMRFPLELFTAMRKAWPEHKPMSVRISSTDWKKAVLSLDDLVKAGRLLKSAGADLIDCSAGQTVADQEPVYGRMFQTPFADLVRNEAGVATMAVGNITTADQVNTIVASGRADLVALARPHLTNPNFVVQAAAEYNHRAQFWPSQYLTAKKQAFILAERNKEELLEMKLAVKPKSHKPD